MPMANIQGSFGPRFQWARTSKTPFIEHNLGMGQSFRNILSHSLSVTAHLRYWVTQKETLIRFKLKLK